MACKARFAATRLAALLLCSFLLTRTAFAQAPIYVGQWGTSGSGSGQFAFPLGLATDAAGDIFVTDWVNDNVQKFSSTGAFISQWGSSGSADGQFLQPYGVATDAAGDVYVADMNNNRIQKFDAAGGYITQWGSYGSGDGQFINPVGIATDASGFVYVSDHQNARVQKFTSAGVYVAQWGTFGIGSGQFDHPYGVAVDPLGNVYVVDTACRLQKFTATGSYILEWGGGGSGNGQFQSPRGLATDPAGNIYVADSENHRIQMFTGSGTYVTQWGTLGSGDGQLHNPHAAVIGGNGLTYVADTFNTRVQIFGPGVDTLAPPAPASVGGSMASGLAFLSWPPVSAPDLAGYHVFRGPEEIVPTDATHLVGTTTTTTFGDTPGFFAHYRVTAFDVHGNESPGTLFIPFNPADVPGGPAPKVLSVGSPSPSPMAHGMSMTLGLPRAMSTTVDVLDSQGRLVRRLCEGERPAGWLTLSWDARDANGHAAAAGIYFVRVQTPEGRSVRRLALIP